MIVSDSAALILSAVQQLVKLGGRIDALMAQATAVKSDLVLGMPALQLANLSAQIALARKTLQATSRQQPDPFGSDRRAFEQQVALAQPDASFDDLFAKYFPDAAGGLVVTPDAAYLKQLQQAFPGLNWKDPGVRLAAFAIAAGGDDRQISYNARVALAVVDTLLEFGAATTPQLVHDEKLNGILLVVIQRFAQPDWDQFEQWNPLLQTTLKVTLNAALDVGQTLPPDNPWLAGLLDALAQARTAATNPDDYLLGLFHGQGVHLFLTKGLLIAGDRLDDDQSDVFKQVAADVLKSAIPFVEDPAKPEFRTFFEDHWGDLLRAGLSSLADHGDGLIDPGKPLLGTVLKAVVHQLAETPDPGFLSSETLCRLTETAIGVVADHPDQLSGAAAKPWLRDLLAAAAQTAKQLTLKKLFTPAAAEALTLEAVGVLAKYPNLIVSGNGLPLTLTTEILSSVAELKRVDARALGETTIRAALNAIAHDPGLITGQFGPVVTAVATQLSDFVAQGKLNSDEAAAIASTAIDAIARNPRIYAGLQKNIAGAVVSAVQRALPADNAATSWARSRVVEIAGVTLSAIARSGAPLAKTRTAAQLETLLANVLAGGLTLADQRLGTSVDLNDIAPILGGMVGEALRGKLTTFDPAAADFIAAFDALASQV